MLATRVIPCLLLEGDGLVKTVKFRKPTYVGDPINTLKIFNEKEVDELVFLDITATIEKRQPNFSKIEEIASECFMPIAYGGGVRDLDTMGRLFELGVEKVVLNAAAAEEPDLITRAAERFGSQSVVVAIDVKRSLLGKEHVVVRRGRNRISADPVGYAGKVERLGAGEILLTAVDREGTLGGFDLSLVERVAREVKVPVVAHGGARSLSDLQSAVRSGASAVAAGSLFVFHGKHRGVLINYPSRLALDEAFAFLDAG